MPATIECVKSIEDIKFAEEVFHSRTLNLDESFEYMCEFKRQINSLIKEPITINVSDVINTDTYLFTPRDFKEFLQALFNFQVSLCENFPNHYNPKMYESLERYLNNYDNDIFHCLRTNKIGRASLSNYITKIPWSGPHFHEAMDKILEDTHGSVREKRYTVFCNLVNTINRHLPETNPFKNLSYTRVIDQVLSKREVLCHIGNNDAFKLVLSPYYEDIICISKTQGLDHNTCFRPQSDFNRASHVIGCCPDSFIVYLVYGDTRFARCFGLYTDNVMHIQNIYGRDAHATNVLKQAFTGYAESLGLRHSHLEYISGEGIYHNSLNNALAFTNDGSQVTINWEDHISDFTLASEETCINCDTPCLLRRHMGSFLDEDGSEGMVCSKCIDYDDNVVMCRVSGHFINTQFANRVQHIRDKITKYYAHKKFSAKEVSRDGAWKLMSKDKADAPSTDPGEWSILRSGTANYITLNNSSWIDYME